MGRSLVRYALIYFQPVISKLFHIVLISIQRWLIDFFNDCRGMALCFILMFGRIGAVIGGNLIGALIGSHCNVIFIFNAVSLSSKLLRSDKINLLVLMQIITFYL